MGCAVAKKGAFFRAVDDPPAPVSRDRVDRINGKRELAPGANGVTKAKQGSDLKCFTEAEVQNLITQEKRDIVVVHEKVYDVTSFVSSHPGGEAAIKSNVGREAGPTFDCMHPASAHAKLETFLIGTMDPGVPVLAEAEVQRMIKEEKQALVIIHNYVYDLTDFVGSHPGGQAVIASRIGEEVGSIFERIHSSSTKQYAKKFVIGRIAPANGSGVAADANAQEDSAPLKEAVVLETVDVGPEIKNITFSCPERLRLSPGGHIVVLVPTKHKSESIVERNYTPFVCEETRFVITVKKYPNGVSSPYLHSLKVGDSVKYKGPFQPAWIAEKDTALLKLPKNRRHVLFIAGGVGLTPIYPMVSRLLKGQLASVTLFVSYQIPEVMLLRKELALFCKAYGKGREKTFDLHYIFTRTKDIPPFPETENIYFTRFGLEEISKLTPTSSVVICGPPTFADSVAKGLMDYGICGYENVHVL